MTAGRAVTASVLATALAVLAPGVRGTAPTASAASLALAATVAPDHPALLTATTIDVTDLVFVGTTSVPTASSSVTALEFTVAAAAIHDFSLAGPCVGASGLGVRTTVTAGAVAPATASAGMTLFATDLQATVGVTPVHFSADDPAFPPPPAGATVLGAGTLGSVSITVIHDRIPSFAVPGLTAATTFCTP